MLECMEFARDMATTGTLDMLEQEVVSELHYAILPVKQLDTLARNNSLSEMDESVYELDARQLGIKAFIKAWFAAREQRGNDRKKARD